ncbi:hypothetical protein VTI74DRAFT_11120 [Chaetomium olivicolor]
MDTAAFRGLDTIEGDCDLDGRDESLIFPHVIDGHIEATFLPLLAHHNDGDLPSRIMGLAMLPTNKPDEYFRIGRAAINLDLYHSPEGKTGHPRPLPGFAFWASVPIPIPSFPAALAAPQGIPSGLPSDQEPAELLEGCQAHQVRLDQAAFVGRFFGHRSGKYAHRPARVVGTSILRSSGVALGQPDVAQPAFLDEAEQVQGAGYLVVSINVAARQ